MPKALSDLKHRIVPKQEVMMGRPNKKLKKIVVKEFAEWFKYEDGKHIAVGEAVETGPFENEDEGKEWLKYYVPDTVYNELKWGKEQNTDGDVISPVVFIPQPPKEDGIYIWVVRITE